MPGPPQSVDRSGQPPQAHLTGALWVQLGGSYQPLGALGPAAATLRRQWPQSTLVRNLYAPLIDAAGHLHDHQPAAAVIALEAAAPYDLAEGNEIFTFALYPAYLRGLAYLAEGNKAAAAAQFQEIVRHPGVVQNEPIGALARARLQ